MRILGLLSVGLMLITACGRLPLIDSAPPGQAAAAAALCQTPYVPAPWRFVHAISADIPGRRMGRLIGVSVVDPGRRTAEVALMTVEGLVVFAARWDGQVSATRALAPFENNRTAEGLMADIRLLFFPPDGPPASVGRKAGGQPACRYREKDGAAIDVIVDVGRGWEIHRYDLNARLIRAIRAQDLTLSAAGNILLPSEIEIEAHRQPGYHLTLDLLSAEPVED